MARIQGLFEKYMTASEVVKSAKGEVHSITIAFKGVTAGQMCFLRDGTDAAAPIAVPFTFDAAQGTIVKQWPQGKVFCTGIFWDAGPGDGGDNVFVELTAK